MTSEPITINNALTKVHLSRIVKKILKRVGIRGDVYIRTTCVTKTVVNWDNSLKIVDGCVCDNEEPTISGVLTIEFSTKKDVNYTLDKWMGEEKRNDNQRA